MKPYIEEFDLHPLDTRGSRQILGKKNDIKVAHKSGCSGEIEKREKFNDTWNKKEGRDLYKRKHHQHVTATWKREERKTRWQMEDRRRNRSDF